MGRTPNPERKPELLEQIVDELARTGIGDVSLRPLASAIGVSTFTLSYHFGSKEQLLAEALEHVEQTQVAAIEAWRGNNTAISLGDTIRRYWDWVEQPDNLARLRLVFEAAVVPAAAELLPADVRSRLVTAWIDGIVADLRAGGVPAREATIEASVAAAAITGLAMDLMSTSDRPRTRSGLERVAQYLDALIGVAAP